AQATEKLELSSNAKVTNFVDSVDNTYIEDGEHVDSYYDQFLISERTDDPGCVVPIVIGNKTFSIQLDCGALPNVVSPKVLEAIFRAVDRPLLKIRLRRPIQLRMANDAIVKAATHVVIIDFNLGPENMSMPFYVMDTPGLTFIMGRVAMDVVKITPCINERVALCSPRGKDPFSVPYIDPDRYHDALSLCKIQLMTGDTLSIRNTTVFNTRLTIPGYDFKKDRDKAYQIFIKNLQDDLQELIEDENLSEEEILEGMRKIEAYKEVFSLNPGKYNGEKVHFSFIEGQGHLVPFRGERYRPPNKLKEALDLTVEKMLALEIIRPSRSIQINTLAPVIKKNGEIRFCLAADELNKFLQNILTEPATMEQVIFSGSADKYFCTLDFTSGFWQLELDEDSKPFTAFIVNGQVYEFNRLPYGLKISSGEFVHMINQVIPNRPGISKYVDDIKVSGKTFSETLDRLLDVLQRIKQAGLTLNPTKTRFFKKRTEHLGFVLSENSIEKQDSKGEKFDKFELDHTKKGKFSLNAKKQVLALL
ncbi:unnamed protein product, partial [Allacma fusca]